MYYSILGQITIPYRAMYAMYVFTYLMVTYSKSNKKSKYAGIKSKTKSNVFEYLVTFHAVVDYTIVSVA
jgi:hypothetical protein